MSRTTVDPAILRALGLDPSSDSMSASITSHGGSGFSSTYKLRVITKEKEKEKVYFVKTGIGSDAANMFLGEHHSLNAIHSVLPSFCPRSYAHGSMSSTSSNQHFLVTDFLDLVHSSASARASGPTGSGSGESFAAKLAKMHTTPAPIPEGRGDKPMFGFPVPTYCGATEQDNAWKEDWAEFYADNRLRHILRKAEEKNGNRKDKELSDAVETVASKVVPRLLGEQTIGKVTPVLIHGDLWSGNQGRGRFSDDDGSVSVEAVVYDPAAVYGHSEYELGIMNMFGGFGEAGFWKEYGELVPKGEPKEEWEDRVALYELYHHLNHYALFGGGYRGGAMSIMKKLIAKY
ncbi:Fructosamine/Ketosamine-3-kinase, partial [Pseudoneurospora amorphoporcata]